MQYVNLIRQYTYHKKLELKEAEYQYGVESGMETGLKQGIEQGRKFYLIQNICKKLRKNKDAQTIAIELEEDLSLIQKICDAAKEYSPEYDENEILKAVLF